MCTECKRKKERKPKLSLSPGENPEFFTRAETPPAGRQWISSEAGPSPPRAPPRRTGLHTARLFRGKQEKERTPKLSLSPGENPEFFTRAETPPAGRQWISSEAGPSPPRAPPRRTGLHTARLFRGKQEKERTPKLSLSPAKTRSFSPGRDAARRAAMDLIRGGPFAPSGSPAAHGSAHGAAVPGQTRKGEKAKAFSPYTGSGQIT